MRLMLMGTGPFAVPSFRKIVESGYEVLGVVTRPPVPNPRSKGEPFASPVVQWAQASGLAIHHPPSINEESTIQWLRSLRADLMVVCDYGQILSREALGASKLGGINLHGSLLPRHRGAAPVQWSILAGDPVTGVSVIHMTPKLDGGPVLAVRSLEIGSHENAQHLEQRLSNLGVEPTMEALALLATRDSVDACAELGRVQSQEQSTRAPRLKKEDGQLDFRYSVNVIDRQIRGLQPWPGTFGSLQLADGNEIRLIVHQATPVGMENGPLDRSGALECGTMLYGDLLSGWNVPAKSLGVLANDGLMLMEGLQPAGKKRMTADEFLRGYGRQSHMKFITPETVHPLLSQM